jgi:fluoride ion exporter CrcB/FEX
MQIGRGQHDQLIGWKSKMSKPRYYFVILIGALLLALARFALDALAEFSNRPPLVQFTMDIVLILILTVALFGSERRQDQGTGQPIATRSKWMFLLIGFGFVVGLTLPIFTLFILRP